MNVLTQTAIVSKRMKTAIKITAICLPFIAGSSSVAQAADCSPQQVRSFSIKNSSLVKEGSRIAGVAMQVQTTIKNTNAHRPYRGYPGDNATNIDRKFERLLVPGA